MDRWLGSFDVEFSATEVAARFCNAQHFLHTAALAQERPLLSSGVRTLQTPCGLPRHYYFLS